MSELEDYYDIDFDFLGDTWNDEAPPLERAVIDEQDEYTDPNRYFLESQGFWQQIPLPEGHIPSGGNPLAALSDEDLLDLAPHVICHIQRTAAQGGLQVVSPRQVPITRSAARTAEPRRTADMCVVGSIAHVGAHWPSLGGTDYEVYFDDDPVDGSNEALASRYRTTSHGIVPGAKTLRNPIGRAIIGARAMVDLQRSAEVGGDANALSALLADCWGVDRDQFDELSEASIAPSGSLLRYAIRPDDVYPTYYAPIQVRKSISVGMVSAGRTLYGETSAIDWRRLRLFAEFAFYAAITAENFSLKRLALAQPPGDTAASPVRAGVLQFRPLPGSVWSFASETFRVTPVLRGAVRPRMAATQRVFTEITNYYSTVGPISIAKHEDMRASLVRSRVSAPQSITSESITRGYTHALALMHGPSARGRTASATVRSYLFTTLEENSSIEGMRLTWYLSEIPSEARAAGLRAYDPIEMARRIAGRLTPLAVDMRYKIAAEAEHRGSSVSEWWRAFGSSLPAPLAAMHEGTISWVIGAVYMCLTQPTDRWRALLGAVKSSQIRSMIADSYSNFSLPVTTDASVRAWTAAGATVRRARSVWGGYYMATSEAGAIVAALARTGGQANLSAKLELAAALWAVRAACSYTVTVSKTRNAKDPDREFTVGNYAAVMFTAPYRAYENFREKLAAVRGVKRQVLARFPEGFRGVVSRLFENCETLVDTHGLCATRLTRYLFEPKQLAADIEETLSCIADDVETNSRFAMPAPTLAPVEAPDIEEDADPVAITLGVDMTMPTEFTVWDAPGYLEDMEEMAAAYMALEMMSEERQEILSERVYRSVREAVNDVFDASDKEELKMSSKSELVR